MPYEICRTGVRILSSILILPADKGRATVVIDVTSYEEKALSLLQDDNVYAKLKKDPT